MSKQYEWQPGDTFSLIALKYQRRERNAWRILLDHNIIVVRNAKFDMKPGMIIEVPDSWLTPEQVSYTTKIIGTSGRRIVDAELS